MNKKLAFIDSLEKTLVLMNVGILGIDYRIVGVREEIVIYFGDSCKKTVNISCNSNLAIVADVLKALY